MNELFKNASEIIKAAASDPLALAAFIILVFAVLFFVYATQSKRDYQTTALFLMLMAFSILLIFILRPSPCWDGSRTNPCPLPPPSPSPSLPLCWDGSRASLCPKKPWIPNQGVGEDKQGRKAKFDIYVLTSEYNWEVGTPSSTNPGNIRYNGELRDLELLRSLLQAEDMERVLKSADVIISFGTASCQGGSFDEENRALERASLIQTLVKSINSSRATSPVYRRLNLGQFKSQNCSDPESTAFQRSIIVVGADITRNPDVDVKQALRDFLEILEKKEGRLGTFKLGDYSQFDFQN
jgi:hypothetical protein